MLSRCQHCCCLHSTPLGPRLPVFFPRCLAARSEAHAQARKLFSGTSLTRSPWTLGAVCPCSGFICLGPFWGTLPSLSCPIAFLRSSSHPLRGHSFRTTALASLGVSFAHSVSVPLGSPSFAPLPGFSQVNLFSLQSRPLRVPLSGSRPLFPPVHLGRISSLTPVPPEFSRLSHGPESLFKSPR